MHLQSTIQDIPNIPSIGRSFASSTLAATKKNRPDYLTLLGDEWIPQAP
jgi:hypothetical protein